MNEHNSLEPSGTHRYSDEASCETKAETLSLLDSEPPNVELRTVFLDDPEAGREAAGSLSVVRTGLSRHGNAFLAYLVLDGIDQRSLDLIAEFEETYYGYFESREAFVEHQLDALGWSEALTVFCQSEGIWPSELTWDAVVVWEHLSGLYRTTEQLGGVHVFAR